MTDKYSNEDLPLFSPELPLTQIKEDENDDKRDSLEKIADISNEIFKKINEIKDSHTNSSESASSSLLLFYCISTISTFVFYLEASETFPFLFLRIITFGTLFLGFHFLLKLGNKSKDRFVFNVVAISSNFITSSVVLEAIGCFSTSNFSIFSLEKHSRLFVKDFQSIILSLALILMNNSIKPDLLDLITSLLIILFQIAFNRFFLSMFFPISCYLELLTWCILTITGIKLLKKQKSLRTVEKQKKLDSVGIETRKVLDILNQVQNSLQENYDQIAPETISKGDDLMRKLKFLKFQTLLNFNNQEKTQRRKSISGKIEASKGVFSSNKSKIKTPLSPRYKKNSRSFAKKNTSIIDAERAILLQKIEAYDYAPGAERIQKDKRWSLTPDDVDDIMNGILSKPSVFWLPNFLRTNNSRDIDVDSTNWVILSCFFK